LEACSSSVESGRTTVRRNSVSSRIDSTVKTIAAWTTSVVARALFNSARLCVDRPRHSFPSALDGIGLPSGGWKEISAS
jgi:hypothetical protein